MMKFNLLKCFKAEPLPQVPDDLTRARLKRCLEELSTVQNDNLVVREQLSVALDALAYYSRVYPEAKAYHYCDRAKLALEKIALVRVKR